MPVHETRDATLRDRIEQDYRDAMKARDASKTSALRMLKAAIQIAEKTKGSTLDGEELSGVLLREVKIRKESITEFGKGNRADLVRAEEQALQFLTAYLPAQLSDDELLPIVNQAIEGLDPSSRSNPRAALGLVMRTVMPEVRGRADAERVSGMANELLTEKQSG